MFRKLLLLLFLFLPLVTRAESMDSLTDRYPHLKEHLFEEPRSNFYLGFGLAPIGIVKSRLMFMANFFQAHWISSIWDLELLSASYGFTAAQPAYVQASHFVFRTAPKISVFGVFSIGPLIGYEFISFPEIKARLTKNSFVTPYEPFSSKGVIYGGVISETVKLKDGNLVKLNQVFYRQTYSTYQTEKEWSYSFDKEALKTDRSPIEAESVIMMEVSLLF